MMKCKMCPVHMVAGVLVIVGALNWGLVGLFQFNLVSAIFGTVSWLERLVYVVVGLSGLAMLFVCKCKKCGGCCEGGSCCNKDEEKKM